MLTNNLSRSEFACKCGCGFDTVDHALAELLQVVRDHFRKPVRITSGCRCEEWNRQQGGKPRSQHLIGRAADFTVDGVTSSEVHAFLAMHMDAGGLKNYGGWVHVDTRSGYWRG